MGKKYGAVRDYWMAIMGAFYVWWISGDVPDRSPAWAVNAPPPKPEEILAEGLFCMAVINLALRVVGMEIPTAGNSRYDGGMVALDYYYREYWQVAEPFDRSKKYPDFTIIYRRFIWGGTQGHVAVIMSWRGTQYVVQSYDSGGGRPGMNWDSTLADSDGGWYYEYAILPENWLGPDNWGDAGDTDPIKRPSDVALARALDPHLGNQGSLVVEMAKYRGLPLHEGCGLLEKESHGRNIFGCDHGDVGDRPPYCGQPCTPERVQALIDSPYMNGIGPSQLTWYTFVNEAHAMPGGASVPRNTISVGFRLLKAYLDTYPRLEAYGAYNAGEGNRWLGIENGYAGDLDSKVRAWKEYLARVPVEDEKPDEPEPPEEDRLSLDKYTFAAVDQPAIDFANAAATALKAVGVDAASEDDSTNIFNMAKQADASHSLIVVGRNAYNALPEGTEVGWKADSVVWDNSELNSGDVGSLRFCRNWCVGWIAKYAEGLDQQRVFDKFDAILMAIDTDKYWPLLEEVQGENGPPPPPEPKTLEERVAVLEGEVKELRKELGDGTR